VKPAPEGAHRQPGQHGGAGSRANTMSPVPQRGRKAGILSLWSQSEAGTSPNMVIASRSPITPSRTVRSG
jgi:hypothetical protein